MNPESQQVVEQIRAMTLTFQARYIARFGYGALELTARAAGQAYACEAIFHTSIGKFLAYEEAPTLKESAERAIAELEKALEASE